MAQANVKKFVEMVEADKALQEAINLKIADSKTEGEAIAAFAAFSEEKGVPFTVAEFKKEQSRIPDEQMDNVAGGTDTECCELRDAFAKSSYWTEFCIRNGARNVATLGMSDGLFMGALEETLDSAGIEANCSQGLLGLFSKNNTYKDKATGAMLLHSEVIEFLKTGRKTW